MPGRLKKQIAIRAGDSQSDGMRLPRFLATVATTVLFAQASPAAAPASTQSSAESINAVGLDLAKLEPSGNLLLSPFSIQTALAMTSAGASAHTLEEMRKTLHLAGEEAAIHEALRNLSAEFEQLAAESAARVKRNRETGGPSSPVEVRVANRLFGQQDFGFKRPFLETVREQYGAPLETVDFRRDTEKCRQKINGWVEKQTQSKIRDLIGPNDLDRLSRLVLVNALYFKASWSESFSKGATRPSPFVLGSGERIEVPMMALTRRLGYARRDGFQAVRLPYEGGGFQFLVLVPDSGQKLATLEGRLTPRLLAELGESEEQEVALSLPKFRIQGATLDLSASLQKLGMRRAFDQPKGSAEFERMAERKPDDYLAVSKVLHKTFLELDENGTEAAAATAVVMAKATAAAPGKPPVVVRVDRPFWFAVQHRNSGACLFIGRVNDPR